MLQALVSNQRHSARKTGCGNRCTCASKTRNPSGTRAPSGSVFSGSAVLNARRSLRGLAPACALAAGPALTAAAEPAEGVAAAEATEGVGPTDTAEGVRRRAGGASRGGSDRGGGRRHAGPAGVEVHARAHPEEALGTARANDAAAAAVVTIELGVDAGPVALGARCPSMSKGRRCTTARWRTRGRRRRSCSGRRRSARSRRRRPPRRAASRRRCSRRSRTARRRRRRRRRSRSCSGPSRCRRSRRCCTRLSPLPHSQVPSAHVPPVPQLLPQLPQLRGSMKVLVQAPLQSCRGQEGQADAAQAGVPGRALVAAGAAVVVVVDGDGARAAAERGALRRHWQTLLTQVASGPQTLPQPPQSSRSVVRSTQVSLQLVKPLGQPHEPWLQA